MERFNKITAADAYNRPASILAMALFSLTGSTIPIIIPSFVDAMTRFLGVSTNVAAAIMAGEMLGMTVATAVVALIIQRFDRRSLALVALTLTIIGNAGSMAFSPVASLYLFRGISGVGEGAAVALGAAALGATSQPARNFAIFIAANMLLSASLFRAVPIALQGIGINGAFAMLIALAVLAALALPLFPRGLPRHIFKTADILREQRFFTPPVTLSLLSFLLFYIALGIVWPVMPVFAEKLHFPRASMATSLSNATLTGFCAALGASVLGTKWGRLKPLVSGAAVLVASMLVVPLVGAPAFAMAAASFMGAWLFSQTYYMAILSAADATGRAVALSMTLQFCGLAIGPLIGPRFNNFLDGFGAMWVGIGLVALATAVTFFASPNPNEYRHLTRT